MNKQITLLRTAYWYGAIVDAISIPPMLSPKLAAATFGIDGFDPPVEYRYAMYVGAALMAGWTVLLLWADRRPIERRGVLVLTVFPVVVGMLCASTYAGSTGFVGWARLIPMYLAPAVVVVLYLAAYVHTTPRRLALSPSSGDAHGRAE